MTVMVLVRGSPPAFVTVSEKGTSPPTGTLVVTPATLRSEASIAGTVTGDELVFGNPEVASSSEPIPPPGWCVSRSEATN